VAAAAAAVVGGPAATAAASDPAAATSPSPTASLHPEADPKVSPSGTAPATRTTVAPSVRRRARSRPQLVAAGSTRRPQAHATAAGGSTVTIRDFAFGPPSITVSAGQTVTWINSGPTAHTATAKDGSFDTGTLRKGASGSHTFTTAGTFSYVCSIHPSMHGTVTVRATGTSAPAAPRAPSAPAASAPSSTPSPAARPAATAHPHGPTLPNTGANAALAALAGLTLLLIGWSLRRARA
jgi:LPXTG-motif cell wall-anchored protein